MILLLRSRQNGGIEELFKSQPWFLSRSVSAIPINLAWTINCPSCSLPTVARGGVVFCLPLWPGLHVGNPQVELSQPLKSNQTCSLLPGPEYSSCPRPGNRQVQGVLLRRVWGPRVAAGGPRVRRSTARRPDPSSRHRRRQERQRRRRQRWPRRSRRNGPWRQRGRTRRLRRQKIRGWRESGWDLQSSLLKGLTDLLVHLNHFPNDGAIFAAAMVNVCGAWPAKRTKSI